MSMTISEPQPRLRAGQALTLEERTIVNRETLIRGFMRYPILSQTLLPSAVQIGPYLAETRKWALHTPDPEANGAPYLSVVPLDSDSRDRTPRYYLSRYDELLKPLYTPKKLPSNRNGIRAIEEWRVIRALNRFPILSPSLMQGATGVTKLYWSEDLAELIESGVVRVWHPDLLDTETHKGEDSLAMQTKRYIRENVTYRGVRYFLDRNAEVLKVFLVK